MKAGDADVALDLRATFATVYDRARYDLSLDYRAPLAPPAGPGVAAWIAERLAVWPPA